MHTHCFQRTAVLMVWAVACLPVQVLAANAEGEAKKSGGYMEVFIKAALQQIAKQVAGGSVHYLRLKSCQDPVYRQGVIRRVVDVVGPKLHTKDPDALALTVERNTVEALQCSAFSAAELRAPAAPPSEPLRPPPPPAPPSASAPPATRAMAPTDWIDAALNGALSGDLEAAERAVLRLEALPKPVRPMDRGWSRTLNEQGLARFRANRLDEATELFRQAADADGGNEEAVNNFGYVLLLRGQLAEGAQKLVTTLTLAPRRASAWINLGYFFGQTGQEDGAMAANILSYRYSRAPNVALASLVRSAQDPGLTPASRNASRRAVERITGRPLEAAR